jgi:hypothetical protein
VAETEELDPRVVFSAETTAASCILLGSSGETVGWVMTNDVDSAEEEVIEAVSPGGVRGIPLSTRR